jgi:23S rRNA pseudouridine955/2504/2580 synthase
MRSKNIPGWCSNKIRSGDQRRTRTSQCFRTYPNTALPETQRTFAEEKYSVKNDKNTATSVADRVLAPGAAVAHVPVDESGEGQRLDNFLTKLLKGVPKTHLYRVIRDGQVRVDGKRAQADTRLSIGQTVRVPPVRVAPASAKPAARAVEFPVLYEDEVLLVIDKPAGVAVHAGSGVASGVIEQLRAARPEARFLELAHRLDRETSGILVLAKKRSALTAIQAGLRQSDWKKEYLAGVIGRADFERKEVKLALSKADAGEGQKKVLVDEDGQFAWTRFAVKQRLAGATLLSARIMTGRTHQIRVHAAALGLPIIGDEKYGDFAFNKAHRVKRMLLHSHMLEITHPALAERIKFVAPLPKDFENELGKYASA